MIILCLQYIKEVRCKICLAQNSRVCVSCCVFALTEELRELINGLRTDLVHAHEDYEGLHRRLTAMHTSQTSDQPVLEELHCIHTQHQQLQAENAKLQKQLEQILNGPDSDSDPRIIPVLKEQLAAARTTESDDVDKLKSQLSHSENVVSLLKQQLDLNSQSHDQKFNPEVILELSREIERLREDLALSNAGAGYSASVESLGRKPRPRSATTENRSRIPRLERSSSAGGSGRSLLGGQPGEKQLKEQLGESKVRIRCC